MPMDGFSNEHRGANELMRRIDAELRERFAAHGADHRVVFSPAAARALWEAAKQSVVLRDAVIDVLASIALSPANFAAHASVEGVRIACVPYGRFSRNIAFSTDDLGPIILMLGPQLSSSGAPLR